MAVWPTAEPETRAERGGESALGTTLLAPRLTGQLTGRVRLEMLERGFSLVGTPGFLDLGSSLGQKKSLMLPFRSKLWWKYPQLAQYGCRLESLVGDALPEESLRLTALELRRERAGYEDKTVDTLHADGSYIRSVCTLYGPCTVYRDGDAELSVPRGRTLLMTAIDRARYLGVPCTLHRRPGAGPERAVIVCSFEPREVGFYRKARIKSSASSSALA